MITYAVALSSDAVRDVAYELEMHGARLATSIDDADVALLAVHSVLDLRESLARLGKLAHKTIAVGRIPLVNNFSDPRESLSHVLEQYNPLGLLDDRKGRPFWSRFAFTGQQAVALAESAGFAEEYATRLYALWTPPCETRLSEFVARLAALNVQVH